MNPIQPTLVGRPNFPPQRDLVDWENIGTVVALGVDLENYSGEIYLKPKHVIQIGQAVGMVPKTELDAKETIIKHLQEKIKELENSTGEEITNDKLDNLAISLGNLSDLFVDFAKSSSNPQEEELPSPIESKSVEGQEPLFEAEKPKRGNKDGKNAASLAQGIDF